MASTARLSARAVGLVSRSAAHSIRARTQLLVRPVLRYNSASALQRLKEARELKDKLQRDWKAPILTYEQVKPKTERPSPVRHLPFPWHRSAQSIGSQDAYLIDVREPDEVLQGVIPSSVNIPLSVLSSDLHLHEDVFRQKYGFNKPRKEQEITFYCRSGKRSASAVDVAKRNGYTKCAIQAATLCASY
jgi:rhodanese-related sulfurtransferase